MLVNCRPSASRPSIIVRAMPSKTMRTHNAIATAPDVFRMYVEQRVPWMGQAVYDHMLEGLRKAGWREVDQT